MPVGGEAFNFMGIMTAYPYRDASWSTLNCIAMDITETDVKSRILTVAGLPDEPDKLDDSTSLGSLAYDEAMCDDLAEELDKYVKAHKPDGGVASVEISAGITAGGVVSLVKTKLK